MGPWKASNYELSFWMHSVLTVPHRACSDLDRLIEVLGWSHYILAEMTTPGGFEEMNCLLSTLTEVCRWLKIWVWTTEQQTEHHSKMSPSDCYKRCNWTAAFLAGDSVRARWASLPNLCSRSRPTFLARIMRYPLHSLIAIIAVALAHDMFLTQRHAG